MTVDVVFAIIDQIKVIAGSRSRAALLHPAVNVVIYSDWTALAAASPTADKKNQEGGTLNEQ